MIIRFPLLLGLVFTLAACTYTMKIKDGATAFDRKQYAVAVDMLKKEYRKTKSRVEKGKIAFMLGESYKNLNQSQSAIDWYKIAYDNQYGFDALREYAYTLKQAEEYEEARQAFKDLGFEIGSPYEFRREVNACEVALGWKEIEYPEYEVKLAAFNSGSSDYSPVPYGNRQLVFSSDRAASTGDDTYNWTGRNFSDLFVVDLDNQTVAGFETPINSPANEGTSAFSADFKQVFFTRCDSDGKWEDAYCKIFFSEKQLDGSWTVPQPLAFQQADVNYGHPTLSADGQTLYFSSNHPDGWGGYDIWRSQRTPDGWSEPLPLSRSINTERNEKFPFSDGDTLYFASDGHTGMGGLDVFRSYKLNNGSWAPAFNLLPPVNSGSDDFSFFVDRREDLPPGVLQTGFFTSSRASGAGADDIYRFRKIVPPIPEPEEEEPEEIFYTMTLKGYVLEKIYEEPDNPNTRVLGRKPLPGAEVNIRLGDGQKTVTVGEDGLFSLELDENTDYQFKASKENYLTNVETFSTKGIGKDPNQPDQEFLVEIVLDKVYREREITLENIYYDFDRWEIRDDAEPTLQELASLLKLNPERKIQLGSHTDCRGSNRYNQELSQRRAQSAVDYLIGQGIEPTRLTARGYGESSPAVDCVCARCSEEEHQMNRRTTFMFIE